MALYDCQPLKIGYLSIYYEPPQGFTPPEGSWREQDVAQSFVRKVYPVADSELHYERWGGFKWREDVTIAEGPGGINLLLALKTRLLLTSAPRPERLIGWLPPNASTTANGLANPGHVAAWVKEQAGVHRGTLAHELAHTYGRDHTGSTTNGYHWFDIYERKIQPAAAGDELYDFIFGEGHVESEGWVAPGTHRFLFGKMCGGAAVQTFQHQSATGGDNVLISGIVNNVVPPTGTLSPLLRTTTAPTHIPDPPAAGPGYCVKLKNVSGGVLAQYCFDVSFVVEASTPTTATQAPFALVVPYPSGLARVELTRGTTTLLASRTPSANSPSVTLTFPNAPGMTLWVYRT